MFAPAHVEAPFVSSPAVAAGFPWQAFAAPLDIAVRRTARRYGMSAVDVEELRSNLWLQCFENRRGLRERFASLAHPERYLTRVARNMVLDGYIARYGRRRPPRANACDSNRSVEPITTEAGQNTGQRRRFLGEPALARLECGAPSPLDEHRRSAASVEACQLRRALRQGVSSLSPLHRELLFERYVRQRTVADIAAARNLHAPRLYREYESMLRRVRQHLHDAGFDVDRVREVLEQRGFDSPRASHVDR